MIRVDAEGGSVQIEFEHGGTIQVEGLPTEFPIERGDEQRALFLAQEEAETLGKMIDYILGKVKITPESQAALQAVRPRLEGLFGD